MFKLISEPFDVAPFVKELRDHSAGAFTSFEGWVRDHHNGQKVIALEYEALAPLCESEADKILNEVKTNFGITHAICLHRTGRLSVGEMSVWVGVSAPHRDEAFRACRYIIDELKKRLPIWKKEFLADGGTHWVNCQHDHAGAVNENEYYSRQTILPEFGQDGQAKLKASKILVVGAGGLGSAALTSLAQAGIGTIGIVEFDQLQSSNLHRQSLYKAADVGKRKIDAAAQQLEALNPFLKIEKFPLQINSNNFEDVIFGFDIILDCTDNFKTKFLLNDIAVLYQKILIQASIYQFEGQLRVYSPLDQSSCLRCLWPQVPSSECVGNCTAVGVVGVVPNAMGHLQAWEAIKWVLDLPERLQDEMLIFNFKNYEVSRIKQFASASCPLCGENPVILTIQEDNPMSAQESDINIDIETIPAGEIEKYIFVDVREDMELMMNPVNAVKSLHLPYSEFGGWEYKFEQDKKYLIYCAHGMRSLACVEGLRDEGINNVQSVNHGADAVNQYFASHPKANS